jgi:hypothetical protein
MSSRLLALSSALGLVISASALAHTAASAETAIVSRPALEQGISGADMSPAKEHRKHKHKKSKGKGKDKGGDKEPAPAPGAPPPQ